MLLVGILPCNQRMTVDRTNTPCRLTADSPSSRDRIPLFTVGTVFGFHQRSPTGLGIDGGRFGLGQFHDLMGFETDVSDFVTGRRMGFLVGTAGDWKSGYRNPEKSVSENGPKFMSKHVVELSCRK